MSQENIVLLRRPPTLRTARTYDENGAPVSDVADAPPEGLVEGAEGLHLVPLVAVQHPPPARVRVVVAAL